MPVYEYDPKTDTISASDFLTLASKGFTKQQLAKRMKKLKEEWEKTNAMTYEETCPICGCNRMFRTGTCVTCPECCYSSSCG